MTKKAAAPSIRFKGFSDAWEQRKVGDFYDFKNGLNKGKAFFGKGTPIVNFTDVFHKRGITTQMLRGRVTLTPSEISNYGVKQGDIFVTRTSETIEEIGYASVMLDSPKDTVFSGFVLRGRAIKEDPLTLKFKQFVFSTDAFRSEMIKKSSMTTRALTSGTAIKKMYFQYPVSTEEQNRIGQFLESLDHLITLHQRKYEKLTNVKKSMLEKMFPQNGSSYPEIRFKGFTDPWEQRKFGDITELKSASRVHKGEWTDSGVPFFRSSDVMAAINGTTNEKAYISEELYQKLSSVSGKLEKGDVLITGGGSVGNPYIVPNNEPLYTKDADLLWIKNQGRFHPYYLYEYFFSPTFRTHLSSISHVGTIAHYTITQLSETPICLPDIEEQVKVGEYFESLDNLITLHQRKPPHKKRRCSDVNRYEANRFVLRFFCKMGYGV